MTMYNHRYLHNPRRPQFCHCPLVSGHKLCFCHLNCDGSRTDKKPGHYHCPCCSRIIRRKDNIQRHLEFICQPEQSDNKSIQGNDLSLTEVIPTKRAAGPRNRYRHLLQVIPAPEKERSGGESSKAVSSKAAERSSKKKAVSSEESHASLLKHPDDLELAFCQDKSCHCGKFHCPLCPKIIVFPCQQNPKTKAHLKLHLTHSIKYGGIVRVVVVMVMVARVL